MRLVLKKLNFRSAKETADAVMKEFNLKKRLFSAILRQLQRVLAFMILRVLWGMGR